MASDFVLGRAWGKACLGALEVGRVNTTAIVSILNLAE